MTDYSLISKELKALTSDVNDLIANLSNASALLNMELTDINWVGFYLLHENELILGPFQGKPPCWQRCLWNCCFYRQYPACKGCA